GHVLRQRPARLRPRAPDSRSGPRMKPLALVTGVGPGTGAAIARRFADGGYRVAMLARDAERLSALEAEIPDSIAVPCDVTDAVALKAALARVGAPKVVVHNAV